MNLCNRRFCIHPGGVRLFQQRRELVGIEHDGLSQIERRITDPQRQVADEIRLGQLGIGEPRLLTTKQDADPLQSLLVADLMARRFGRQITVMLAPLPRRGRDDQIQIGQRLG